MIVIRTAIRTAIRNVIRFVPVAPIAISAIVGSFAFACHDPAPAAQQPPPQYAGQYPPGQYPPGQNPPNQYPPQPTAYPPPTATSPQPYPPQPYPPQPYPPQPTAPQPQPPPPSTAPPTPTFPVPIPPPAPTASGPGATPIDPNFAAIATGPLFIFAATEAAGMTKDGPLVAAQFQQGQVLETAVTLQPNKCYAVLAVGIGIQEVDITLVLTTPIPNVNPTLARDTGAGAQSSLGGKGRCYTWQAPIAAGAKFVIMATKGAGIAAGQMYVK